MNHCRVMSRRRACLLILLATALAQHEHANHSRLVVDKRCGSTGVVTSTSTRSGVDRGLAAVAAFDASRHRAPEIAAAGATPEKVTARLASAPLGVAILAGAFDASLGALRAAAAAAPRRRYACNNGKFSALKDERCAGAPAATAFASRRRMGDAASLAAYFACARTDLHVFIIRPRGWANDTLPGRLFELVYGGLRRAGAGDLARALRRGHKPIFSASNAGTSISFHVHGATWFALLRGSKVWFLAPPGLAHEIMAVGNAADAPTSVCEWLDNLPHPAVRVYVQRPGTVFFFGGGVPHATCALEEAWGVGVQLGWYPTLHADLRRDPDKSPAPSQICALQRGCFDDTRPRDLRGCNAAS